MLHIVLDLETMGNNYNAAIVAIGAVAFTSRDAKKKIRSAFEGNDAFYANISLTSSVAHGLVMDQKTVQWWMHQDEDARRIFDDENAMELFAALTCFRQWIEKLCAAVETSINDVCLWGNGSDFDNAILANAYKQMGLAIPWPYWGNRCLRTIKNLFPDIKHAFVGTKHNALDDARNEAWHLMSIAHARMIDL